MIAMNLEGIWGMSVKMSATKSQAGAFYGSAAAKPAEWNWLPELPLQYSPIYAWPPDPAKTLKWLVSSWIVPSQKLFYVILAVITWLTLQPALERTAEFEPGWIAQIYARNFALMVLVAGGLHLYFYWFGKQGKTLKYDPRDLVRGSRRFTWRDQVLDNMFWTLGSAVAFWTAYEALLMWAQANEYAPNFRWNDHPFWFVLFFPLIPIGFSMHFYWVHRFLHWKPLYRIAHSLHHRNVNTGPWSGVSMHPIEHGLYMSSLLIHLVVPSHPIHILFHTYWLTLAAVTAHTGFGGLLIEGRSRLALGAFYHQLHHRYFECNYGDAEMPWDKWFGSFHDGTPEAHECMRQRQRQIHGTG
jgi:sterol desaturase/sphingolipid hydroxylase (fatty acid hydroxylase superfamily)